MNSAGRANWLLPCGFYSSPRNQDAIMSKVEYPQAPTNGLVTVVMPTYRADDYIGEALATIAGQEYPHWELIVVEDASRGRTEGIVKQFAQAHPRHRVVYYRNEKNSGPSHSRNVAFLEARGEFIALLDADDRWLETHLAASLKVMGDKNADLVYSTVVMIEDQTELLLGLWGPNQDELDDFPHGLFTRSFITPSATVFRRSVVEEVGLWAVNLRLCEDLDFWLRCVASGKKFALVGGCHCLYRQNRPEAATKNKCAVQESVARVVERYLDLPGTRIKTCRNRASKSFVRAARFHAAKANQNDPSRNPHKIPELYLKAWKLRPKRVDYLLWAACWRLANSLRPKPAPQPPLPVSLQVAGPRRKAA
jgi:glycosyltransferase involved in cell wall biosynthesis